MLHLDSPAVRDALWSARFGLEREALRVTRDGRMSRTPHPFPQDDPRIVRDFCENQTEINTGVSESAAAAVAELEEIDARLRAALAALPEPETLWLGSNPPPLGREEDIPAARFTGTRASKTAYREYAAARFADSTSRRPTISDSSSPITPPSSYAPRMKHALSTPSAPAALGPYSQGIDARPFVFVSGQLPVDPATGEIPDGATAQAERAFANVRAILEAAGLGLGNVVKTTVFLADLADFAAVNEVYARSFSAPFLARSCVQVAALPRGARLEVEAIAVRATD